LFVDIFTTSLCRGDNGSRRSIGCYGVSATGGAEAQVPVDECEEEAEEGKSCDDGKFGVPVGVCGIDACNVGEATRANSAFAR